MTKNNEETDKGFESIVYYRTWAKMLKALPAELRCKIRDAIDDYIIDETMPDDSAVRFGAFSLILERIKEDKERYANKCRINSKNITEYWERIKAGKQHNRHKHK